MMRMAIYMLLAMLFNAQTYSMERSVFARIDDQINYDLLTSAHEGNYTNFQRALVLGARTSVQDVDAHIENGIRGATALHYAARSGGRTIVNLLLDFTNANALDDWRATALHYAAGAGMRNVVQLLLRRGASINRQTIEGTTALHHAAVHGHLPVVEYLVDHGANIHLRDQNNFSPLHWALLRGHTEIANYLLDHGAVIETLAGIRNSRMNRLHYAAVFNMYNRMSVYHMRNLINQRDLLGRTSLHLAVIYTRFDMVGLLTQLGGDINVADTYGYTPLHYAARMGYTAMAEWLIKHGADGTIKNKKNQTAFELALEKLHYTTARKISLCLQRR